MPLMADRKKKRPGDEPLKGAARYKNKVPLNLMIRRDIRVALDAYLDGTSPAVALTSAVETALMDFLRGKDCWHPPADKPAPEGR